jgi:hypothetical protein
MPLFGTLPREETRKNKMSFKDRITDPGFGRNNGWNVVSTGETKVYSDDEARNWPGAKLAWCEWGGERFLQIMAPSTEHAEGHKSHRVKNPFETERNLTAVWRGYGSMEIVG